MALLMCCSRGRAAEALPVSLSNPALPCYATMQEAAQEALQEAGALGGDLSEAGGAIYRHGPLYCFTQPVTQNMPQSVNYRIGLIKPDKLVGLYHTHPGELFYAQHLSTDDKDLSSNLHVAMYVLVVRSRAILTYNTSL